MTMNAMTINFYVLSFITDPHFHYKLLGQLLLFLMISAAAVYGIYKMYSHVFPRLTHRCRLIFTAVTFVVIVCLVGLVTEAAGL